MLSPFGVILIGTVILFACLFAIYLFSIRINGKSNCTLDNEKKDEISSEITENLINSSNSKKNKKKFKENSRNQKQPISSSLNAHLISPAESNESLAKFDEEDDIIALASLKGYDTTGIRRRSPEKAKVIESAPVETRKLNTKPRETEKEKPVVKFEEVLKISKSEISTTENIQVVSHQEVFSESAVNVTVEEWSHVPTREEEAVKNLKNKMMALEAEIEESELKLIQNSRALEQSQKRINLLEQELKEQRKLSTSTKIALEAQITSLRAINTEIAGKLVIVEADALNASLLKNESERSKEANARLQADLRRAQDEKNEIFRQLSEVKTENEFLREQAYLVDSLNNKCVKFEEELEEARRQMELQIETSQTELKLTRAKLESEIAFHRAEHANSVGSSTALHQEISQLKSEINNLTESEKNSKSKAEEFEKLNLQLLSKIEEFESTESELEKIKISLEESEKIIQSKNEEISKLENDLKIIQNDSEIIKSKLISCESEISSLTLAKESADSSELLNLRNQLAEAEIKISALQSDLTREIKRADISKKVYETKLAMLEKGNN